MLRAGRRLVPGRGARRLQAVIAAVLAGATLAALLNGTVGVGGRAMAHVVLPIIGELVLGSAVAAIGLRAALVGRDRLAWTALCCAALSWMGGDLYRMLAFPDGIVRVFPSLADAGYLLLYPFAYVGLWLLIRARASRFRRSLWLDGLIGASGVGAVGASFVVDLVLAHTGGSFSTIATNVAYPLLDVLLLAQVVVAMALTAWRPGRTWLLIAAGLAIFSAADAAFAYTSATGHTYEVAIGPFWLLAFVLIAAGAWQHESVPLADVRIEGVAVLAAPLTFALLSTALLAYGQAHRLDGVGAALAVTTLVLVMVRTALTFRGPRHGRARPQPGPAGRGRRRRDANERGPSGGAGLRRDSGLPARTSDDSRAADVPARRRGAGAANAQGSLSRRHPCAPLARSRRGARDYCHER